MDKLPNDCINMDEVRVEIDKIDDAIIDLLATRWRFVDRAWQLKATPEEATVPWRIQQVIDKVRNRADAQNFPPSLAEALWRQIIGWGIQHEEEKLRDKVEQ